MVLRSLLPRLYFRDPNPPAPQTKATGVRVAQRLRSKQDPNDEKWKGRKFEWFFTESDEDQTVAFSRRG